MASITVITATFNSIKTLPALVESLKNQSDPHFKWIICDGRSSDGTVEYLKNIKSIDLQISSQNDFGIYDALNRGVSMCKTDYYLTVGSDDTLSFGAIEKYKSKTTDNPGLVFAKLYMGDRLTSPSLKSGWLRGMADQGGCHSVGTLIKTELHDYLGFYSKNYPICADQLFIGKCFRNGVDVRCTDFVAGHYSVKGVSSTERLAVFSESYRIQLELGHNKFIQTVIFILKLIKNYNNI